MTLQDLKIYISQSLTLGVVSITGLEISLKIILLLASIIYTAQRIWINHNEKKNK
tara:strand:- start:415 stop:579 length:165 start_codon:yes stop_codon:yes gene_type:complete